MQDLREGNFKMAKKVDKAGMWTIEANPVTHEGVFHYLGATVDPYGEHGCDPNALYPVYRPYAELEKAAPTFNGKPLINGHEMLGTQGGVRMPDEKNIGGTIYNVRPDESRKGWLVADMTIFSEEIQEAVRNGKKELSLGYWCRYRPEKGEWNGVPYDFVQYDLEGNHIALVEKGRMGSGVRVFDNAETDGVVRSVFVYDNMEATMIIKPDEMAKTIGKQATGDESAEELKKRIEEKLGKDGEEADETKKDGEDGDDEKPDAESKDDGEEKPDEKDGDDDADAGKKPAEDGDDADGKKDGKDDDCNGNDADEKDIVAQKFADAIRQAGEKKDYGKVCELMAEAKKKGYHYTVGKGFAKDADDTETKKAEDSAPAVTMKDALKELNRREELYKSVLPHTGSFAHDEMTATDVAKYAAEKMGVATVDGAEVAIVEAYCKAYNKKGGPSAKGSFAEDGVDVTAHGKSEAFRKYLGE